jgi:hypothetical protein
MSSSGEVMTVSEGEVGERGPLEAEEKTDVAD